MNVGHRPQGNRSHCDEILAVELRGELARRFKLNPSIVHRLDAQPIAVRAECEDSLDRVPPVWQLATDVQREVQLRGRNFPERLTQGAALAGVKPLARFALTRVAMSSSAVISAACQAKRAS